MSSVSHTPSVPAMPSSSSSRALMRSSTRANTSSSSPAGLTISPFSIS